jgi:hypothetical protein
MRGQGTQGSVTGRVTDSKGQPVQGAMLNVKGSNNATVTDANGFFKLNNISATGKLVVSCVGFEPKELRFQPGYITIEMKESATSLNDEVVVGYSVSSELSSAVAGVNVRSADKKVSIQTVSIVTQFQPTTMVYKIEEKYTLETDGKMSTIGIKQFEVPAIYDYTSTPKIDPAAFLTAGL